MYGIFIPTFNINLSLSCRQLFCTFGAFGSAAKGAKSSRVAMEMNSKIPLEPNPAWHKALYGQYKRISQGKNDVNKQKSNGTILVDLAILQNIDCKVETVFMRSYVPYKLQINFNLGIPSTNFHTL